MGDYYKILKVPKNAPLHEIKKAYKKLALRWHPDKNPDNTTEANKRFREISEAYEVLADPKKRQMYDKYGKDLNQAPSRGTPEFFDFGFSHFNFRDPEKLFREFFGGSIFDVFDNFGFHRNGRRQGRSLFLSIKCLVRISVE